MKKVKPKYPINSSIHIRIDDDIKERFRVAAEANDTTMSKLVVKWIKLYIIEYEKHN